MHVWDSDIAWIKYTCNPNSPCRKLQVEISTNKPNLRIIILLQNSLGLEKKKKINVQIYSKELGVSKI